jgi:hypothetical protein
MTVDRAFSRSVQENAAVHILMGMGRWPEAIGSEPRKRCSSSQLDSRLV